jgi:putative DNA primase/helicase
MIHGWTFAETRMRVIEAAGLRKMTLTPTAAPAPRPQALEAIAQPSAQVLRLRRERCAIEDCDSAVDYLASRYLWPLPPGCSLRAHSSLEYRTDEGQCIGRYPGIVADIVDIDGELVAVHRTYLSGGKKLAGHEPRKQLGRVHGRTGVAVRLMAAGPVLGIAEGIETALSAAIIHEVPVWSALNAGLLEKFEPPPGIETLVIYADRDVTGLSAANRLQERMQARIRAGLSVDVRVPLAPAKDWNDSLANSRKSGEGKQ